MRLGRGDRVRLDIYSRGQEYNPATKLQASILMLTRHDYVRHGYVRHGYVRHNYQVAGKYSFKPLHHTAHCAEKLVSARVRKGGTGGGVAGGGG